MRDPRDDASPWVVRRQRDPEPGLVGRVVGYLVPAVVFAVVGGVALPLWLASEAVHASAVLERADVLAAIGAAAGALAGAFVAWRSEQRPRGWRR